MLSESSKVHLPKIFLHKICWVKWLRGLCSKGNNLLHFIFTWLNLDSLAPLLLQVSGSLCYEFKWWLRFAQRIYSCTYSWINTNLAWLLSELKIKRDQNSNNYIPELNSINYKWCKTKFRSYKFHWIAIKLWPLKG